MPGVGVLRWSSNASYGFKVFFADFHDELCPRKKIMQIRLRVD